MKPPSVIAPGLFTIDTENTGYCEEATRLLSQDAWSDATILHHKRGSIVDAEYRNASVIGPMINAAAIDRLDRSARELFFPFFCTLGPFDNLVIDGSQFVRYNQGGFFKAHRDAGYEFKNRCFTIICYLSECGGGETVFPEIGVSIAPKQGLWIAFFSEYLHIGAPVTSGQKFIFVTWAVGK